jgi:hypothetical protein
MANVIGTDVTIPVTALPKAAKDVMNRHQHIRKYLKEDEDDVKDDEEYYDEEAAEDYDLAGRRPGSHSLGEFVAVKVPRSYSQQLFSNPST